MNDIRRPIPNSPQRRPDASEQEAHRDLLSALVCPLTGGPLVYRRDTQELVSVAARIAFPIRDGIPIMVSDEARELSQKEVSQLSSKGNTTGKS